MGTALIQHAVAHLRLQDRKSLGLAVTSGSPAGRRDDRLGFEERFQSRALAIDDRPEQSVLVRRITGSEASRSHGRCETRVGGTAARLVGAPSVAWFCMREHGGLTPIS